MELKIDECVIVILTMLILFLVYMNIYHKETMLSQFSFMQCGCCNDKTIEANRKWLWESNDWGTAPKFNYS